MVVLFPNQQWIFETCPSAVLVFHKKGLYSVKTQKAVVGIATFPPPPPSQPLHDYTRKTSLHYKIQIHTQWPCLENNNHNGKCWFSRELAHNHLSANVYNQCFVCVVCMCGEEGREGERMSTCLLFPPTNSSQAASSRSCCLSWRGCPFPCKHIPFHLSWPYVMSCTDGGLRTRTQRQADIKYRHALNDSSHCVHSLKLRVHVLQEPAEWFALQFLLEC